MPSGKSFYARVSASVLVASRRLLLLTLLVMTVFIVSGGRGSCADVPPKFQEAYKKFSSQVSTANLRSTVNALSGFGSRIAGYPGDKQRRITFRSSCNPSACKTSRRIPSPSPFLTTSA